jgi:transposase
LRSGKDQNVLRTRWLSRAAGQTASALRRKANEQLEISASSVVRWVQQLASGLEFWSKAARHSEWILALAAEQSDLTLDEIVSADAQENRSVEVGPRFGVSWLAMASSSKSPRSSGELISLGRVDAGFENRGSSTMVRPNGRGPRRERVMWPCSTWTLADRDIRRGSASCRNGAANADPSAMMEKCFRHTLSNVRVQRSGAETPS